MNQIQAQQICTEAFFPGSIIRFLWTTGVDDMQGNSLIITCGEIVFITKSSLANIGIDNYKIKIEALFNSQKIKFNVVSEPWSALEKVVPC